MFKSYKFLFIIILSIFLFPIYINPIKFKFKDSLDREHIIQSVFDTGLSLKAVSDAVGITDYETLFSRVSFMFDEFGIGLNLEFRFRFFLGQAGYYTYSGSRTTAFRYLDWYIPEGYMHNAGLNTFIAYLDKIDYIKYGSLKSPFYFHIGKNPYTTFGSGFILQDFHNHAFLPVERELGLYFKFDGNLLEKLKMNNIPIDMTLLINDLADPDIFAYDFGINVLKFTKYRDLYTLRIGASFATDINSTESNRCSSYSVDEVTSHRNLTATDYNLYTSFPLFSDINTLFIWQYKFVKLIQSNEIGLLLDFNNNNPVTKAGFGIKSHIDARFINLVNSGYLLGVSTGVILESPHYFLDYFASNYEVLRKKQYLALNNNNDYTFYIMAGLGLYGFNEKIKFEFNITMPLIFHFCARFTAKFIMEDTIVPGLFFNVLYQTGVNAMYIEGSGQGFIDSLTRDFRFAFEAGYNFFGAKLSVLIGVQRPWYAVPGVKEGTNPYRQIADGYIIPDQYTAQYYTVNYSNYNWAGADMDTFSKDIQKFVSVEISFVF
jgi:hypothetical protein